jgi:carboxypeptidase family protein/TonB-dependent receptor-like protein
MDWRMRCRLVPLFSLLLIFLLANVSVQAQLPTATLGGIVTDPQGAAVVGARVVATNKGTGIASEAPTGSGGEYAIVNLPPGLYNVHVEAKGFAARDFADLRFEVGRNTTLDVQLALAALGQKVTVTGGAAQVDLTQSTVQNMVTSTTLQNIPLNGRNFLELAFLLPGNRSAVNFDPTKTNTLEVSSAGQFGRGGNISVDGGDNNDEVVGGTLANFPQDGIQEFQIATNRYTAEVGRSASSIINIITKSGTNEYHGSAFIYERNKNLQGLPAIFNRAACANGANCKPPFDRQEYGGSVGGPIIHDKAFWFFSIENRHQNGAVQSAFRDFATDSIVSSSAQAPLRDVLLTGSGDLKMTANDRFFLRYSFNRSREVAEGSAQASAQTAANRQSSLNRFNSGNANWTRTISASQVNSLIFHFDRFLNSIPVFTPNAPTLNGVTPPSCGAPDRGCEIVFPDLEDGPNFRIAQRTRMDRLQFKDTFAWTLGRHTLHFGGEYQKQWSDALFDLFGSGSVFLARDFPTSGNDANIPVSLVILSGAPVRPPTASGINNSYIATYIQDDWRARPNLTFNVGLRWEYDTDIFGNDSSYGACPTLTAQPTSPCTWVSNVLGLHRSPDRKDIGPRLGFAWDPFNKGKTVIRGGYGIYYDRVVLEVPLLARLVDGRALSLEVLEPPSGTTLLFGNFNLPANIAAGQLVPAAAGIGINIMDNNIRHPYVQQFTLGIQHQIGPNWLVSVDGIHDFGTRFLIGRILRPQAPETQTVTGPGGGTVTTLSCPGNFGACTVTDPLTGLSNNITSIEPSAKNWYDAMLVSVQRRPTRFFNDRFSYTFNVNYTLSKTLNYANDDQINFKEGGQADVIEGVNNLRLEKGYATTDERHRLVFYGVFGAPYDISVSPIWTITSSIPGNPFVGALGGHLPIIPRNSLGRDIGTSDKLNAAIAQWDALPACSAGGPFPCRSGASLNPVTPGMHFGKPFNSFDMRASKMFKLTERNRFDVMAEAFNLFNITNVRGRGRLDYFGFNNDITSSLFNQKAQTAGGNFGPGGPRAFQFALRYSF